ncbi:MAG: oligosaccharide flippase family protein [Fibromonadales bacterium]|nr:oligosaccharide flippase family protein [Fibromonadales bacterium]
MRTRKSIRNVSVMLLTQFITLALAFVSRTVFIKALGAEYLGLNGLFLNILNALSLAEMGIGAAISYALYKPIAEDNREQIKSLLAFYRKCYFAVGAFVVTVGCLLIPFLPYLIKGEVTVPVNLSHVYLCFLANSAIGYFFMHKRTIIDDTQNKYITNSVDFIGKVIISIVQIFILVKFQNYMSFLYAQIAGTLLISATIYFIANKKFPYIKDSCEPLPQAERKKIWSNISILFLHKFGGVAILGTDFLIISAFVGISEVGIYSNYTLIITTVSTFVSAFIIGSKASIGNAIATLGKDELYNVFKKLSFLIFCISGFSSVCLLNLLNPFIDLWIGEAYILPYSVIAAITMNFFFTQSRWLVLTFKQDAGIFRPDMYKPLIEVAFNLSLSIFLVHYYGILGVVIATLANTFFICIGIEAYIIHKHLFKRSVWIYAKSYLIQISALLVAFATSFYINGFMYNFVLKCLVSISISIVVYFLFFFKTEEFKYFVGIIKKNRSL